MTMLSDFSFGLKLPMFWLSLFKGHRTKKVNNAKYRLLQYFAINISDKKSRRFDLSQENDLGEVETS